MAFFSFLWTDEIVEHVAEHGLTQDDFEQVVNNPTRRGISRSSSLPAAWGYTVDGRYIIAIYEEIDELDVIRNSKNRYQDSNRIDVIRNSKNRYQDSNRMTKMALFSEKNRWYLRSYKYRFIISDKV